MFFHAAVLESDYETVQRTPFRDDDSTHNRYPKAEAESCCSDLLTG